MLIGAIEAQLNIINYELKFTLDNGHFITGVENMCNLAQGLIIENRAAGRMEGILVGKKEGLLEGRAEEKYEILINLLEQTDISLKKIMKIVGLVKKEEVKEMTDRLIEDLTLKEGYINGKPTTITIERIVSEKDEVV